MDCKEGIVSRLKEQSVVVLIERHSACSECHARGACTSADKGEESIEVADFPQGIQVGDRVRIVAVEGGTPLKAVLFAFVIPLVLLAVVAIVLSAIGASDELLLLSSLVLLLLYGGVLWLLRSYFARVFRMRAERV